MNNIVSLFILAIVFSLCACSSIERLGYWVDDKPLRGTREANKFNKHPYWQCVGPVWSTHNLKEC